MLLGPFRADADLVGLVSSSPVADTNVVVAGDQVNAGLITERDVVVARAAVRLESEAMNPNYEFSITAGPRLCATSPFARPEC